MAAYSAHSGVEELVQLKQLVDVAAIEFDTASSAVVVARKELEECARIVETTSQQQLALLQRREYGWTAQEGTDFATCVADDIKGRQQLDQCRQTVTTAEHAVTSAHFTYMNVLRQRYHEETLWQDKWRVLGTYGTWSLIVLNTVVFVGSQYVVRQREHERMETLQQFFVDGFQQQQQGQPPTLQQAAQKLDQSLGRDITNSNNNNDNDHNKNDERIGFEPHETTTTGSTTKNDSNTDKPVVEFLEETINKTVPLECPDAQKKLMEDEKEKENEEATMTTTTTTTTAPPSESEKTHPRRFLGGGGVFDATQSSIASIRATLGKSTTATTSFLRRCRRRISETMENSVTATTPTTLAAAAAVTRSTVTTLTTHTFQVWRETTTRLRREYPLDVPSALVGSAVTGIMLLTLSCLRGSSSSSSSSSSSPPRR